LAATEWVSTKDGDKIQFPKRCVSNKKTGRWIISRNTIIVPFYINIIFNAEQINRTGKRILIEKSEGKGPFRIHMLWWEMILKYTLT
jgi:hypothetical protein